MLSPVVVVLFAIVFVSVTSAHISKRVHARTPFPTIPAMQRVLVVVHCLLVLPGVAVQSEPLSTLGAGVRRVTHVGQLVIGEMTSPRERFSALGGTPDV